MTETAQKLRKARSKHLLTSYEEAVRQFAAFREVLPITERKSRSSANFHKAGVVQQSRETG